MEAAMRGFAILTVAGLAGWFGAGNAWGQTPQEAVYDATLEFNLGSNPNGVWSYQVLEAGTVSMMKVTDQAFRNVPGLVAWMYGKQDNTRAYVASNTTLAVVHSGEVRFPKGELVLKADSLGGAILVFKAPEHGLYRVSGFFEGVDKKEQDHMLQIAGRKVVYFSRDITQNGERASFHFFLSMKQGDLLNFGVASTGGQRPQRGATGLNLLIKGPGH